MAEIGLTATGKWHLLGKHGCHYVPDVEFVETRHFDERTLTDPEWGSVVVPECDPDASWCRLCERTLSDISNTRFEAILETKAKVPYRDIQCETVPVAGDCEWCGIEASATRTNDDLAVTVCPACADEYNNPFIDVEDPPERDLRGSPPSEPVDPVRYLYYKDPDDRPPDVSPSTESRAQTRKRAQAEHRPYIEVAIKGKYADVVCDLAPTNFRFTTDAIDRIKDLQAERKAAADNDLEHKSFVDRYITDNRRRIHTQDLFPTAARDHADDLAAIARDPSNWT